MDFVDGDVDSHLHIAVKQNQSEHVREILTHQSVAVNVLNAKQETPLSIACVLRRKDIIELLVAFGANPFIDDLEAYDFDIQDLLNKLLFQSDHWLKGPILTSGDTPLHTAVRLGRLGDIQKMLDQEVFIDHVNSSHGTPLHLACALGHKLIVHLLVSSGANMYKRDFHNNAPIHHALSQGHVDIMELLIIDFLCNPMIKGYQGRSLLHFACGIGNIELINKLIHTFNINPFLADAVDQTPLHIAASHGQREVVRLLITKHNSPVDYNYSNFIKVTPLHIAALNRNIDIVEALITEFECDPYARGINNGTVLHYACCGGSVQLVDFLFSSVNLDPQIVYYVDDNENTPLHIAAIFNCEEIVRLLIVTYKCPVNCINKYGQTPLHLTVAKGHLYLCTALLSEFGADANALDKEHRTPLNVAINSGNAELVHILAMEFGCKPYIEGVESKPLLHQLCAGGFTEVLQELILYFNHDPASIDSDGNTLLHTASLYGCYDIVELLVTVYGKYHPVDHRNSYGQTPLHCACIGGHEQVAELLVKNNSMINARDEYDDTPLKNANVFGNTHVLSTILQVLGYNSNINSTLLYQVCKQGSLDLLEVLLSDFDMDPYSVIDKDGNTPLHIAAAFGNISIVLLLMRCGCHIDSINFRGQTPLHMICSSTFVNPANSLELVNLFISEFKADVNKSDYNGDQPIYKSAQAGCTDIIKTLVFDYDCDPLARGSNNTTLLHQALAAGQLSTAKTLIEIHRLSIHSVDWDGNTPLHLSSLLGQEESVKLLLYDYNTPIFVRNNAGQTASDLANEQLKLTFKTYISSKHKTIQIQYKKTVVLIITKICWSTQSQ